LGQLGQGKPTTWVSRGEESVFRRHKKYGNNLRRIKQSRGEKNLLGGGGGRGLKEQDSKKGSGKRGEGGFHVAGLVSFEGGLLGERSLACPWVPIRGGGKGGETV